MTENDTVEVLNDRLRAMLDLRKEDHNHALLMEWATRLAKIGNATHLPLIKRAALVAHDDGNEACAVACRTAAFRLMEGAKR